MKTNDWFKTTCRGIRLEAIIAGFCLNILAVQCFAQQNYLDISVGSEGDGTSWATAYKSLSNAMARMTTVTNLWVAKGTYIVANVDIKTNSLFGGYPTGGGTRDWLSNVTTFDGNFTNRCLQKSGNGAALLDGFIIQNGSNASAGCALNVTAGSINAYNCAFTNNKTLNNANGAAVYVSVAGSSNTFTNCLFYTNSTVMASGGGIYLGAGTHQLYGCVFSNNVAQNYGGAVYVTGGGVTISNCDFVGNIGGNIYRGAGGISFQNVAGTNVIINSRFNSNVAVAMGGAIQIAQNTASYNPLLILRGCSFYDNRAQGGAICLNDQGTIYNSRVQCIDCSFSNNTGRALYSVLGEIQLTGCDLVNNPAGALYTASGSMASNCSFVSNTVSSGGACSLGAASTNIFVNCTFFTNRASGGTGGAIYSSSAGNLMAVTNCIFWGNTSTGTGTNIQNAGTLNVAYSLIGTNANQVNGGTKIFGAGITNADPLFASTAAPYDLHEKSQYGRYSGGSWVNDGVTSPCIDAGVPFDGAKPESYCVKEPDPNGGRINLGCYGNTAEASKSASLPLTVYNGGAPNAGIGNVALSAYVLTNLNLTDVYICWGTTDGGTSTSAWENVFTNLAVTSSTVTNNVTGLVHGRVYYYRCYATNVTGESWALSSSTFTPVQPQYPVTNVPATNITASTAYLNAVLSCSGAVYDVNVYWGTSNGFTNASAWTSNAYVGSYTNISTPTNLTFLATGLGLGATNYFMFRATNAFADNWAVPGSTFGMPVTDNDGGATNLSAGNAGLRATVITNELATDLYIYWGTNDAGTTASSWMNVVTNLGVTNGTLTNDISGLLYGVQYYYRSYASNMYGGSWASSTTNFLTLRPVYPVTNAFATNIAVDSAYINATLVCSGAVYDVYAYWGTSNGFTNVSAWTSNAYVGSYTNILTPTNLTFLATGVTIGTTNFYTFRAVNTASATNWAIPSGSFGMPVISNAGATNIAALNTGLRGTVTTNGLVTDAYVYWGTNDGGTDRSAWMNVITNLGIYNGTFTNNIFTALYGISNYYRCYASNLYGGVWSSNTTNFVTLKPGYTLVNSAASSISATTAQLNAYLTCTGAIYDLYAYWGQTDGGTNPAAWSTNAYVGSYTNLTAPTLLSRSVTGLIQGSTNYYSFRASNMLSSTNWSTPSMSFITETTPMVDNANGATNVLAKSALLRCAVSNSQANLTIYFGTVDGGTDKGVWQNSVSGGTVLQGTYTLGVGGLLTNQLYYYRAYVTNTAGENWAPASTNFTTAMGTNFTPWDRKIPITFSGYTRSETLSDIPLLVTLSNNINNSGFSYSDVYSPYGCDLRFSDDSGSSELPYEVEKWNTNGVSYIWVRVPVLSNALSTIWMYYGRSRQTNYSEYCTNGTVWGNSFRAVWHLNTNELDSSQYKKNGSPFQVTNIAGQIAGGKEFYNNGWVDVPEVALNMDKVTYSVWMKLPSIPDNLDAILDTDTFVANDMQLLFNAGKVRLSVNGNSPADTDSTYTFGASDWNQWRYVTVVYDRIAKTSVFYVNAVPGTNNIYTTAVAGSITAANIGSYNISRYFKGVIDEFSIADTARSSNWIWACYMNMASNTNFMVYGAASNVCPMLWSLPTATNIMTNSADLVAALTGSNADCIVVYDTNNWGMTLENWRFTNDLGSRTAGTTVTNNITNLSANTYYFFMFYATNTAIGTNRLSEVSWFTTIDLPIVDNGDGAMNIKGTMASLRYSITNSFSATVRLFFGTNDGDVVISNWQFSTNIGVVDNGVYTQLVSGLNAGIKYYYRAYATNSAGEAWALSSTNFTTLGPVYLDCGRAAGPITNGSSWADAYASFSNALDCLVEGDELWIAAGVYSNGTAAINAKNVYFYGGFPSGGTASSLADRNIITNIVTIDGKDVYRCLSVNANNVTIDGMTFARGLGNLINVAGGDFTIRNSILIGSGPGRYAQALYLGGTNNLVDGCYFGTNLMVHYGGSGGAVQCAYGVNRILNSRFINNAANDGGNFGYGGAINFSDASVDLLVSNCLFRGNSSGYGHGGAIYGNNGKLTVLDCSFVSNVASIASAGISGGAVYLESGSKAAAFRNCAFAGNLANYYGGAIYNGVVSSVNTMTVENCSFSTNYCLVKSGGAIWNKTADLGIRNSIFFNNIALESNGKEIRSDGAVMYAYSCFSGTNSTYIYTTGALSGSNSMAQNPLFASAVDLHLKSTTGRWDTASSSWTNDAVDSPCIDQGDASYPYANEPAPNGGRINMGAYGNTVYASKSMPQESPTADNSTNSTYFTAALIRGKMTAGKIGTLTIYHGYVDGGTGKASWSNAYTVVASEGQEYVLSLKIDPLTTYYYRTYVTNSMGEDWADSTALFVSDSAPPGGPSNIIHVDFKATNAFFNDGSAWPFAYLNVQDGMDKMNNASNEMWIAKGTYNGPLTLSVSNASMYGGFIGTESVRTQRDWTNNTVTVDGANTYRCLNVNVDDVIVDGVIFNRGMGQPVTVTGNRFSLLNSKILNTIGSPDNQYGSLNLSGTSNMVDNCYFGTNQAARNYGYGGAISCATGDTKVLNSTFVKNKAHGNTLGYDDYGGAIYFNAFNATLTVSNCVFRENQILRLYGGAVYVNRGMLNAMDCNFISNSAAQSGGAIYMNNGGALIKNCAFVCNYGTQLGGALSYAGTSQVTSLTVQNCSFYSNYVNSGAAAGGAIFMNTSPLYLRNCILWQNKGMALSGTEILSSGMVEYAYSCFTGTNQAYIEISGGYVESNNIVIDPLFVSQTDLHLQSTIGRWDPISTNWVLDAVYSPCIDMGDPGMPYANEPDPNGGRINMGAYGNTVQASKTIVETMPTAQDSTSSVSYTAAIIRGKMTTGKKGTLMLYYGDQDGHEIPGDWDYSQSFIVSENQEVALLLKGLRPETIYFYRTFVSNSVGTDWDDRPGSLNFTTGVTPPGAASNVIHVNYAATNSICNDGSAWPFACLSVQDGINQISGVNREIWIAKGTYKYGSPMMLSASDVSIYGGFAGTETTRVERSHTTNIVTIDGEDSYRCLNVNAADVTIDGMTFARGSGKLINVTGGDLTIRNSILIGSGPGRYAQALYLGGTNNLVDGCYFGTNLMAHYGGSGAAIQCVTGITRVLNSTFINNAANDGGAFGYGGALNFSDASVDLLVSNCLFRWNSSGNGHGGAIYGNNGKLTVLDCSFVSNIANLAGAISGGAVYLESGSKAAAIRNCAFAGNVASNYGGALYNGVVSSVNTMTVENCSFSSNSCSLMSGGAIWNRTADLKIRNSIFFNNIGLLSTGKEVTSSGAVEYAYSCFTGTNSTYIYTAGSLSESNNIIQDPLFASAVDLHLKSKYGRWQNGYWVFDNGIMSPCIDAGDPVSLYSNEPYPNGGRINMGAYGNTPQASKNAKPSSLIIIR